MARTSLGSLVVRAADISLSLSFYRALDLDFVEERHGSGPVHFSSDLGGVLLEIYPGEPGRAPERKSAGGTLLGFRVASIERVLSALSPLSTRVLSGPVPGGDVRWSRIRTAAPSSCARSRKNPASVGRARVP